MKEVVTYTDIQQYPGEFLPTELVAGFMGTTAQSLRQMARTNIQALGFPCSIQGSSIKIPRRGFLFWVTYGNAVGVRG